MTLLSCLEKHKNWLASLPGVRMVADAPKIVGGRVSNERCIRVYVAKKKPRHQILAAELIPETLEASSGNKYKTDVVESDEIKICTLLPMPAEPMAPADHRKKFRPQIPGGVSAIVYNSTACTLGFWALLEDGSVAAVTNAHCQLGPDGKLDPDGADNWQPSPFDGGTSNDKYGTKFIADFDTPEIDISIVRPTDPSFASPTQFELGDVVGEDTAQVSDTIYKSGRTSGVTSGVITSVNAVANVSYGPAGTKLKTDLILVDSGMLQGGDSGDCAVKKDSAGGLLVVGNGFAGSSQSALFIKWQNTKRRFGLKGVLTKGSPTPPPTPPPGDFKLKITLDGNPAFAANKVIVEPNF